MGRDPYSLASAPGRSPRAPTPSTSACRARPKWCAIRSVSQICSRAAATLGRLRKSVRIARRGLPWRIRPGFPRGTSRSSRLRLMSHLKTTRHTVTSTSEWLRPATFPKLQDDCASQHDPQGVGLANAAELRPALEAAVDARPVRCDPRGAVGGRAGAVGVRIPEELERLGYVNGKTILEDLLRELRPRFAAAAQLSVLRAWWPASSPRAGRRPTPSPHQRAQESSPRSSLLACFSPGQDTARGAG
jgi:hypothetical protein